ncbi:MAG: Rho termination factor N-terminal domain-containing protein, partial [Spirochaetota bacterium]
MAIIRKKRSATKNTQEAAEVHGCTSVGRDKAVGSPTEVQPEIKQTEFEMEETAKLRRDELVASESNMEPVEKGEVEEQNNGLLTKRKARKKKINIETVKESTLDNRQNRMLFPSELEKDAFIDRNETDLISRTGVEADYPTEPGLPEEMKADLLEEGVKTADELAAFPDAAEVQSGMNENAESETVPEIESETDEAIETTIKRTVSARTFRVEKSTRLEKLSINELTRMNLPELREQAHQIGKSQEDLISLKKQELIFNILKAHTSKGGIIHAYGSLEILPDGYGFLRSPQNSYLPGSDDIYISPSQIRLFNLRTGDTVAGQIRPPKEGERFFAMLRVESVNFDNPSIAQSRIPFDNLTPLYPMLRINMETSNGDPSTRIINLFCPIGKGQRGLIVSPPRTGKTILLQKVANSITQNHP